MEKIVAVFNDLLECTTIVEVNGLLNDHKIDQKFHFPEKTYQKLEFTITPEDISLLKEKKILGDDNNIHDISAFSPAEKLLYALIWKNGDLLKMKHIVSGILADDEADVEEAIVFNQFGRYLSGRKNEPIIDQHVLRAFGVYEYRDDAKAMERYRKMSVVTKKEVPLIKRYKVWLSKELHATLREEPEYNFHVDKLLFGLGRYLKLK